MDRKRASVLEKLGRNGENGKFAFGRWLPERNRFHGIAPPSCFISALALTLIVGSGMAVADSGGVYIHDKNRANVDNDYDHIVNTHGAGVRIKDISGDVSIKNRYGDHWNDAVIEGSDEGIKITDVRGDVRIDNRFGGRIIGHGDDGIDIDEARGDVRIDNRFGGGIYGYDDGVHVSDVGDSVTIDNRFGGTIAGRYEDGIDIRDVRDYVRISNSFGGRITGRDEGIKIRDVRDDVTITNSHGGTITGRHGDGIDISDIRGDVTIDNHDGGSITGGEDGARVSDVRGDVVIHNRDGKITGRDNGVQINDVDDVMIANSSGGSIRGKNGDGIRIEDADGWVVVDNTRRGRIAGHDDGIHIRNVGDEVVIDNSYGGRIEGERGNGIDIRNVDDNVWIDNRFGGEITGHDDGVKIRDVDDDVVILNSHGGRIAGERGDGINVSRVDGDVGIDNERGSIQGRDDGIKLSSVEGDVWVGNDGGRIEGRRDTGIDVRADGSVTIDNGDGTIKGRHGAISIEADTATIDSSGLIEGGGRHGAAIELSTEDGATINNYADGLIRSSRRLTDDLIIEARGGAVTINNDGTMIGRIDLSGAGDTDTANVFNNTSNDSWHFTGTSDLGGGLADVFNNTGTIYTTDPNNPAYDDITILAGVEYFNNGGNGDTGTVDLQDGYAGDVFILRPTDGGELVYYGAGGQSALKVDAFLGNPSNSVSDTLEIEGDVTGATAVYINKVSSGFGAYNPYGTKIVGATGSLPAGSFFLANGPIDTGLFSYDLYLNGSNEWVLASAPNQTFFELPSLTSAAQSIWHNAAGAWLDRTADLRTALNETCAPVSLKDTNAGCAKPASGVWAKVLGSSESRSTNRAFTLMNSAAAYSVNTQLDGGGVIGGYDVIRSTADGNGIWMVGVMGGYLRSELNFDRSANRADFQSGAIGAYVTYLQGGWFIDGQFMANLGNVKYSGGQSVKEHSSLTAIGGVIDAGYRVTRGNAFIEPGATLSYVNANIDAMDLYNTSVNFSNGDSLRGRLGVRLGTTIAKERAKYEPFIGVSAIYEFLGANTADVTSGDYLLKATDNLSGALGEVTGGVNVFSLTGNGLSAFAKGNVQFGKDDFVGYGGSLGVRVAW